ncbi:hypothetical protein C8R44DRAFT_877810 [Mycena epipterygia]|nr:hypothetical protein C8R44DRAFT_877810 [Mycena epipterygia]
MALGPSLARAETAADLDFDNDVCPTLEQSMNAYCNFRAYIARILCRYHKGFSEYSNNPTFQNIPRRPLPDGYRTPQFPVRISTEDESSIPGNLAVHYDMFVTQLKMTYPELSKAILSINEQVMQVLNRGSEAARAFDVNPFLRAQVFQLGIGLFHLCRNLIWVVLNSHRSHESVEGFASGTK